MKKIDIQLQNLVNKHNEERQRKLRREKESANQIVDIKMDDEVGQKRARPDNGNFDLTDFGISFDDFDESNSNYEEEFSEKDSGQKEYPNQSQAHALLKIQPFQLDPEEIGFDSTESLFDDMFNLKEHFTRKIEATFDSEWQTELNQSMRMIRAKYREIYDPDHLNKLIEKFVRDHFEIRF